MTVVAMVGLGAMGSRMAERFLGAGHEVVVWNRTPAKAESLVQRGATRAGTPAEAAGRAELVAVMVADPAALRQVTEGPDGVAAGVRGATVAQMSTVAPAAVKELEAALPDGTDLLDTPVLGSLSEAESGTLRVFVGGPVALAQRWSPTLSALGTPMHVGELGAGTAAKLVANNTLLSVLGTLGESLALARALGLPTDTAFEVLAATPLAAQAERRRPAVDSGEYPLRFSLALARKDADLIVGAATDHGVDPRLGEAVRSWFADAERAGEGGADYSSILGHIVRARSSGV